MALLANALIAFSLLVTAYFVLWNVSQIAMSPLAIRTLWRHRLRTTRRARSLAGGVAVPRFVSIVAPAYNEELTIVESLRALLALDYHPREIVIVNDGSTDGTLALLQETFQLVPAPVAFDQPLPSEPVRGIYRSVSEPDLVVIDKHNGGSKADAVNAGINAASGVLVLVIDADTVLEADALGRAVLPFLEDPATVAVGGNVGIANGCRIDHGRVTDVALPRSWLATVPDYRVHARVPPVQARLRVAECGRADLGRIRAVPPRCRDRRRRLRPDRNRRGHRPHDPPAAALPRARRAGPDRFRPQSPLLDAGAGGLAVAAVTAIPLAPRDCSRRCGDIAG